jgi:hypothetical protein
MEKMAKLFEIRVTSGNYAGRYVGLQFGGGLVTNPEVQKNPPVNVRGTKYGLWAQQAAATKFLVGGRPEGVQAELKKLGYETELM